MSPRRPSGLAWRPYYRDCLVVAVATGVIGATFGVFANAAGFDLARIAVMSGLMFTGASQFAAAGVIGEGGSSLAAVASALLLACRNALYGPVARRALPSSPLAQLGAAHFVIDETTALSAVQANDRDASRAFWFTGIALWLCWNTGSLAGAMLGASLAHPEVWGLDAAFPALFMALLVPHLRTAPGRVASLAAAGIVAVTIPLTPAGVPILLAAFAVGPAVLFSRVRSSPADSTGSTPS